jgi:hypothetical protein
MVMAHTKSVMMTLLIACAVTAGMVIGATQVAPREEEADPPGQAATAPPENKSYLKTQQVPSKKAAKAKSSRASSPEEKVERVQKGSGGAAGAGFGPMMGGGMRMGAGMGMSGRMGMSGSMEGGAMGQGGMGMGPMMVGRRGMMDGAFEGVESVEEAQQLRRRLEIAQLSAALPTWAKNPKNEATLKRLDEPMTMAFANETPLKDVLQHIKDALALSGGPPVPLYVDPVGLQHLGQTVNSTVVIDLQGAPLKTCLRLILKQLGLAFCVRDGVLIISSPQGIREELAEAARELFGGGNRDNVDMRLLMPMSIGRWEDAVQ